MSELIDFNIGDKVKIRPIYGTWIDGNSGKIIDWGCNAFYLDPNESLALMRENKMVRCSKELAYKNRQYAIVSIWDGKHYQSYWLHISSLVSPLDNSDNIE